MWLLMPLVMPLVVDTHVGQLNLVVELLHRSLAGFSALVRQKRAT